MIETGNETEAIDRLDEAREYQFEIFGTWDGASVALEEWSEPAGAYVTIRTFTSDGTLRRFVQGNKARWTASSVGASTALTATHARLRPAQTGGPGGSVTASSIAAAMEDATEEQKQVLMPETIEVDYIETTDQSDFEIPVNSFGQKAGVPYFGNSPIREWTTRQVFAGLTSTGSGDFTEIASFSIPGEFMTPSSHGLELDIQLNFSNVGANEWAIFFDFSGGAQDFATGSFIYLGHSLVQQVSVKGILAITEETGINAGVAEASRPLVLANGAAQTHTTAILGKLLVFGTDFGTVGTGSGVENVADTLKIYLVSVSAASGRTANAVGIVKLALTPL